MPYTLAFDVYGTLIDTHGVVGTLQSMILEFSDESRKSAQALNAPREFEKTLITGKVNTDFSNPLCTSTSCKYFSRSTEDSRMIGDRAQSFSQCWRDKQLEYSFRRGLMQQYQPFSRCTADALDYSCEHFKIPLSPQQKQSLLESYGHLPAFADVARVLSQLKQTGHRLYAFSNGSADAVDSLLCNAGIREYFNAVVSVEAMQTFKPNPVVYQHFLRASSSTTADAWLVSSNPFDVIGALNASMRAVWLQRSEDALFDPWQIEPTLRIKALDQLQSKLPPNDF